MVKTEKPESVSVTVRNRKTGESKTFTLYEITVAEAVETIKKAVEKNL